MIEKVAFDAAVEAGIAAFCAGAEPPSDDEAWTRLTGAGAVRVQVDRRGGGGGGQPRTAAPLR